MSDDEEYLVMQPDEDFDSFEDYHPKISKENNPKKQVLTPQVQGKIIAAPNLNLIHQNNTKDNPSLEIRRMIEAKKEFESSTNKITKTITSISSLREDLNNKDILIAKMKADLEKKDGEIQVLMAENNEIPELKKQMSNLKSYNHSLKSNNDFLKSNNETLKKLKFNNNTTKISVRSRLGGRGDGVSSLSKRLGGANRVTSVEGEVKEKMKFRRSLQQQQQKEERELENEYLGLRYTDDEKFEPFGIGNKDEEFEPLPDDLVLTELTENGPKPAKRKRISAP